MQPTSIAIPNTIISQFVYMNIYTLMIKIMEISEAITMHMYTTPPSFVLRNRNSYNYAAIIATVIYIEFTKAFHVYTHKSSCRTIIQVGYSLSDCIPMNCFLFHDNDFQYIHMYKCWLQ